MSERDGGIQPSAREHACDRASKRTIEFSVGKVVSLCLLSACLGALAGVFLGVAGWEFVVRESIAHKQYVANLQKLGGEAMPVIHWLSDYYATNNHYPAQLPSDMDVVLHAMPEKSRYYLVGGSHSQEFEIIIGDAFWKDAEMRWQSLHPGWLLYGR